MVPLRPAPDEPAPCQSGPCETGFRAGIALDFGSPEIPVADQLRRYLPVVAAAEEAGFERIWLGETYARTASDEAFHLPAPFPVLAALSQHTTLGLGTGVLLALAWPPLRLAYEAAVLDQLCDGRLTMGLGLGPAYLPGRFGTATGGRGRWMEDAVAAMRALWAGAGGYAGKNVQIRGGIWPLPVQPGGPPILVGGGIPESARRAARVGDGWYASSAHPLARVRELAAMYRAELAALGGAAGAPAAIPPSPGPVASGPVASGPVASGPVASGHVGTGTVVVNRITIVDEDPVRALDLAETYAGALLVHYGRLGSLPDFPEVASMTPPEAFAAVGPHVALVGTPETVAAQVTSYREAGVTEIAFRVCPPGLPVAAAHRTVELLGSSVLGASVPGASVPGASVPGASVPGSSVQGGVPRVG